MGCKPIGFSLSISNLVSDKSWYQDFVIGVTEIADEYEIPLVGGDFVRGSLNINVVVYGVPYNNKILKRNGASDGDIICISTPIGSAKKGLEEFQSGIKSSENITNYLRPKPKFNIGESISEIATSCIDTSDGLLVDLKHILDDSNVGAHIYLDNIPFTTDIEDINAGDDYEICFTSNSENEAIVKGISEELGIKISLIGKTNDSKAIRVFDKEGNNVPIGSGYSHF